MEINSAENLCKFLISCAFRRCRILDDICRLSVSLKPSPPLVRISVSDTGIGSTLEEFQDLKYQNDSTFAGKWDGIIGIVTTSITDKEVHHLQFDVKEDSSSRLVRLPSATKSGAKFSGTEVSLSMHEVIDDLLEMISVFIRKMLVLKAPKIAVEISVFSGGSLGSQSENIALQSACSVLPMHAANIDCLKSGFEDFITKHGNRLFEACPTCFSTGMNLKVGSGVACSRVNQQNGKEFMEVVIIISDISQSAESPCFSLCGRNTEVLYFRDFSPCSISESAIDALTSIEWKNYGLVLNGVGVQDGATVLEWDNLPPCAHIDIVLHRYHEKLMILPRTQSHQTERSLARKAVKLALSDLKERNEGVLLSERAHKICSYAPDLAKTISGLILSSNDTSFQEECLSLLGLPSQESTADIVENCIKDKIISVVATNDGNWGNRREAPTLFLDDVHENPSYYYDEAYEGSEDAYGCLDL